VTANRRRRAAGAILSLAVAWLALPAVAGWRASAHAQLVASSPGAGEVVAEAPSQLVLVFSEELEEGFSSFDLTDADGATIATRQGTVDPEDSFQLVGDLPPLADGVYQVRWRSLSAADGHTASGFFSFGVGDVAAVPGGGSGHEAFRPDALTVAGRWVGYLGLLAGFGLPILAVVVLRHAPRAGIVRLLGGLMILSAAAVLVLAIRAGGEAPGSDLAAYLSRAATERCSWRGSWCSRRVASRRCCWPVARPERPWPSPSRRPSWGSCSWYPPGTPLPCRASAPFHLRWCTWRLRASGPPGWCCSPWWLGARAW
jgi:methionine-rich copper-binding protein CopC